MNKLLKAMLMKISATYKIAILFKNLIKNRGP